MFEIECKLNNVFIAMQFNGQMTSEDIDDKFLILNWKFVFLTKKGPNLTNLLPIFKNI